MRKLLQPTGSKIIPIDLHDPSLVLYLPLWYPYDDMTGSTIYSYDTNRHSGTVTGATWGTTGRTFDGIDDKISIADDASIQLTTLTMIAWFNYSALDAAENKGLCGKLGYAANFKGYALTIDAAGKVSAFAGDNASLKSDVTASAATQYKWHMAAMTIDASLLTSYLDAVPSGSPVDVSGFTILDSGGAFTVGEMVNDADRFWQGLIGEVILYNRVLTQGDIYNIYDATKWRYK